MPTITIDTHSGFCFGVVRAIAEAERQLASPGETLYCLGEIVHNTEEVQRLEKSGLQFIDMERFKQLRDAKVLIRAHGEPPSTYRIAEENHIRLIDATCPIVLKLQQRIKDGFEQMQAKGGQVLIFGKAGHAEVIGLNGQTGNRALVVGSLQEVKKLSFSIPTLLYSQTTMDAGQYAEIARYIAVECEKNQVEFRSVDSICKSMSQRASQLKEFALGQDAIVFVSGKQSSNGKYLYSICQEYNAHTFFVSRADELRREDFLVPSENGETSGGKGENGGSSGPTRERFAKIGVCGATSTPMWLMEEVAQRIKQFSSCI